MKKYILFLSFVFVTFIFQSAQATTWNWSFGSEAGQFITDGTGSGSGTYNISDFIVSSSSMGAPIGSWSGGQYAANGFDNTFAPYSFNWNGSSVTQWNKTGSNAFNWVVFKDLVTSSETSSNYYLFGWESGDENKNTVDQAAYYSGNGSSSYSLTVSAVDGNAPVPEPATMMLFSIGLLGLAGVSRRKK